MINTERAKQIGKRLYVVLSPHEDTIYKIEDILLFLKRRKAALLYILMNALFLGLYLLHLPAYSYILIAIGLYYILSFVKPLVRTFFQKFILGKKQKVIPPDAPRQRYTVAQISASIATILYFWIRKSKESHRAIESGDYMSMFINLFILFFIFYLFLSFNDTFLSFAILNGLMLLPLLMQLKLSKLVTDISNQFHRGEEPQQAGDAAAPEESHE